MAKAQSKWQMLETLEMNLTPMIDVVFQLIIFFMLVMDMGQKKLENVNLPHANQSQEDKDASAKRLTINIFHLEFDPACSIYARGEVCRDEDHWGIFVDRKSYSLEALSELLHEHAANEYNEEGNFSDAPVFVRGDKYAPCGIIEQVLIQCSKQGIWNVEIGAKQLRRQ
jgi:biopolymer transport protein ExbD